SGQRVVEIAVERILQLERARALRFSVQRRRRHQGRGQSHVYRPAPPEARPGAGARCRALANRGGASSPIARTSSRPCMTRVVQAKAGARSSQTQQAHPQSPGAIRGKGRGLPAPSDESPIPATETRGETL